VRGAATLMVPDSPRALDDRAPSEDMLKLKVVIGRTSTRMMLPRLPTRPRLCTAMPERQRLSRTRVSRALMRLPESDSQSSWTGWSPEWTHDGAHRRPCS
jgi:hypothetical protein